MNPYNIFYLKAKIFIYSVDSYYEIRSVSFKVFLLFMINEKKKLRSAKLCPVNPFSNNPMKGSNTLKQFFGCCRVVGLALKELRNKKQ